MLRKTSLNIHYSVAKVYLTVFKRNRTKFAGKYDKSKHTWTNSNVNDMRRNLFKKRMSLENELGGQQLARAVLRRPSPRRHMDVDVPLHRYEKKTKMRRRERTAKYG